MQWNGSFIKGLPAFKNGSRFSVSVGNLLQEGDGYRTFMLNFPSGASYVKGSAIAPKNWTMEWSTDGGQTWGPTEPNGTNITVTNVRAMKYVEKAGAWYSPTQQKFSGSGSAQAPAQSLADAVGGDGFASFAWKDKIFSVWVSGDLVREHFAPTSYVTVN